MAGDFSVLVTKAGGGLNLVDSPEVLEENEAQVLEGWRIAGLGRITSKKVAKVVGSGDAIVGDVIAVHPYNGYTATAAILLSWDSGTSTVRLYRISGNVVRTYVGTLAGWAGVSTRPVVFLATVARVVFIVDEGKNEGLTCYDPNDVLGSGSALFQPTFDFNDDAAFVALKARLVIEHLNHLWVFGYGDEDSPDRGEIGRFSYLGLIADTHGLGDAGVGGATGSVGLFDREDAVPIGTRGVPIISAAVAGGRLVVASEQAAGFIYGSGHRTWGYQPLDPKRGSLVSRGMCEADGYAFWASPLGFCKFGGGSRITPIERLVHPRLEDIHIPTMFAVPNEVEHQIRWYHALKSDTNTTPNRFIAYDYLHDGWVEETLGIRAFCGGQLRPAGTESPTAAPTSQAASDITNNSVRANWLNGDTSPGVKTEIQLDTVNTFNSANLRTITDLLSGVDRFDFGSLTANTAYFYRVRHIRNGVASSYSSTQTFTTLTAAAVATPQNFAASTNPVWSEKFQRWDPGVILTFDLGQIGVRTHLYRSTVNGFTASSANEIHLTDVNEASYQDNAVTAGVPYYYRAKHEDAAGSLSSLTSQVTVTPGTLPP